MASAVSADAFRGGGRSVRAAKLAQPGLFKHADDPDRSEYLAKVRWVKEVERSRAYFRRKAGLFTSQLVRASLFRQERTRRYIEKSFNVDLRSLLAGA